jgi:hypothetical protein
MIEISPAQALTGFPSDPSKASSTLSVRSYPVNVSLAIFLTNSFL